MMMVSVMHRDTARDTEENLDTVSAYVGMEGDTFVLSSFRDSLSSGTSTST
jgi:hypothetical protein